VATLGSAVIYIVKEEDKAEGVGLSETRNKENESEPNIATSALKMETMFLRNTGIYL
jgi:hypothetical protein